MWKYFPFKQDSQVFTSQEECVMTLGQKGKNKQTPHNIWHTSYHSKVQRSNLFPLSNIDCSEISQNQNKQKKQTYQNT